MNTVVGMSKKCSGVIRPSFGGHTISMWVLVSAFAFFLPHASAQTYSVIHDFSGCSDGDTPTSTLIWDRAGNLYGSTEYGGVHCSYDNDGVVFQLKRGPAGWTLHPLQDFNQDQLYFPLNYGGLSFGPDGNLYGTTQQSHSSGCCGVVFRLQPPPRSCTSFLCPWSLTIQHEFNGSDGELPGGKVIFDAAGNLFGTTSEGGANDSGMVFELSPSNGSWTESILYNFFGFSFVQAGVVMDSAGNLYGSAPYNAGGQGVIYELSPTASGWVEHDLYRFAGPDGANPIGGLVLDQAGNLYGTTSHGGSGGGGTLFQLAHSGGNWMLTTFCNFGGNGGPQSPLTMDAAGNLYGTTQYDGHGAGSVFKATRFGNTWTCSDLYRFEIGANGQAPIGGVTLDANSNLYGTTSAGGAYGAGVIWEITPN